jgi:hypothetical protein
MSQLKFELSYAPVGKKWVTRFLKRNSELQTAITRSIKAARMKEVTLDRISEWFDARQTVVQDNQIALENIYNIDETGFSMGLIEAAKSHCQRQCLYAISSSTRPSRMGGSR